MIINFFILAKANRGDFIKLEDTDSTFMRKLLNVKRKDLDKPLSTTPVLPEGVSAANISTQEPVHCTPPGKPFLITILSFLTYCILLGQFVCLKQLQYQEFFLDISKTDLSSIDPKNI